MCFSVSYYKRNLRIPNVLKRNELNQLNNYW